MGEHSYWFLEGKMQEGESLMISIDKSPFVIGRSEECDLTLASGKISRHHAVFTQWKNNLYIQDKNSTNGTFVNGKAIKQEVLLNPGDLLQVGDSLFRINSKTMEEGPDFSQTLIHDKAEGSVDFAQHYGLSKRETDVLFYLLDGKSGTAIAEALCVSPGTAKNHMLSIYRKTGAHSKMELSTLYRNFETFQGQ